MLCSRSLAEYPQVRCAPPAGAARAHPAPRHPGRHLDLAPCLIHLCRFICHPIHISIHCDFVFIKIFLPGDRVNIVRSGHHSGGAPALVPPHLQGGSAKLAAIITVTLMRDWVARLPDLAPKARLPLRLVLVLANTMAGENSIYTWTRDHRTHHKFSETHGDPHNAKVSPQCCLTLKMLPQRGFFFSHMGWLCVRKHPAVTRAGRTISMADLEAGQI